MERFEPEDVDGTLYLVGDEDRVEIGAVDDIVDAVGGPTYTIEYDEHQRTQPWLQTDDGRLDIDVRETVTSMTHEPAFVQELRNYSMESDRFGLPERTVEFADRMVDIWEEQGTE